MFAIELNGAYLHSDGYFYLGLISMHGCNVVLYKRESAAIKRAAKYQKVNHNIKVVKL